MSLSAGVTTGGGGGEAEIVVSNKVHFPLSGWGICPAQWEQFWYLYVFTPLVMSGSIKLPPGPHASNVTDN